MNISRTEDALVDDRWAAWLQDVESVLDPSLVNLVFPGAIELPETGDFGWSVGPKPDSTALAEDESESVVDEILSEDPEQQGTCVPEISRSQRQQWRSWLGRLGERAYSEPPRSVEQRMLTVCLHLRFLAAGIWETDES